MYSGFHTVYHQTISDHCPTMEIICNLISMKILLSIAFCILGVQAWWSEFEVTGVENSPQGIIKSDLKVSRFNRTTYTISGNFEVTENMETNYDCALRTYFSRKGNNQYTLMPYKLPRENCCQFFDFPFFRSLEKELMTYSNLPKRQKNVPLCNTYTKGVYTLQPDPVDKNIILKHFDTGSYRAEFLFYNKASGNISSEINFFLRLY